MISIKKSVIANEHVFVQALDAHKATLKDWQDHMRRVDSDALNAKVKPIDKHAPYPRPIAHPLIELVMQNGGVYTIEDDTPKPPTPPTADELLGGQKQELTHQLIIAQQKAINQIITPAKHAIQLQRAQKIIDEESKKTRTVIQKMIDSAATFVTGKPLYDAANERSPEDKKFIEEFTARNEQLQAITTKALQARSDIEDLTVTTIKSWKNPEFT
jgi:hypothetical protein